MRAIMAVAITYRAKENGKNRRPAGRGNRFIIRINAKCRRVKFQHIAAFDLSTAIRSAERNRGLHVKA